MRQLFVCHKSAFYAACRAWDEAKRSHVAKFLADEYAMDKAGACAALFGPESDMEDLPGAAGLAQRKVELAPREELIDLAGVWGAIRRNR